LISTRKYLQRTSGIAFATLMALILGAASASLAQTSSIAARLPSSTVGFVEWRGTAAISGAAQNNHVLQLLSDPEMAPVWLGMAANIEQRADSRPGAAPVLSLPDILLLLENPAAVGVIEYPAAPGAAVTGKAASRAAVFLVYDATGKAELIAKWEAGSLARGPKDAKVTHYAFEGASVEVRTTGKDSSYDAQAGNYFLMSNEKSAIEKLITCFRGSGPPANSVTQLPEFREVQKFTGPDAAIDFFARVPDINEWATADAKDKAGAKFIRNIHLEKVQAAGGAVSFAGEAMRMRGAILGDTSPVGPFDLAGASSAAFRTQGIAGDAPEYSVSRMNLAGMYQLLRGAIVANMPPQQAANVAALEGAAQGYLGMPIPEALGLFTGEVASASSYSDDGTEDRVFAATIQRPEAVLRILRAVLGSVILAEDSSGDATVIDIAYPYRDAATGLRRRKLYYIGITPEMLIVAPRKAMLRDALQQVAAPAAGAGNSIFTEAQYKQMRALLPQRLSGLGVGDLTKIPWGAFFANFKSGAEQSAKQSKNAHPPDFSWLQYVKPDVIPRHLHMAVSGWWKDSNGVYFDSYVQ
jgi:hypothetical protein